MALSLPYYPTIRQAIDALIREQTTEELDYIVGNEKAKDGRDPGREITRNGHTIYLVTNQDRGQKLQDVNTSPIRGPMYAIKEDINSETGLIEYAAIVVVPTAGESFEVEVTNDDLNRLAETNSITLNPIQPTQLIKNVDLVRFNNIIGRTSVGYDLEVTKGDETEVELVGNPSGVEAIYSRHGGRRTVTFIDRRNPDDVIISDHTQLPGRTTLADRFGGRLVIDDGVITEDTISFASRDKPLVYRIAGTGSLTTEVNISLKPSIEGYTIRVFKIAGVCGIATYTRGDDQSHFGDVYPIRLFNLLIQRMGLTLNDFFPDGCHTSPIVLFFNVGNSELIINGRIGCHDLSEYAMFAFAMKAWEYDTPEAEAIDSLFGLGDVRDVLPEIHSQRLPVGKFNEATYTFNCTWKELLYQGPSLRVDLKKMLTTGVIGSEVTVPSIGSREFTDERLYPGEAVVVANGKHLIKLVSSGYNWRGKTRNGLVYALQALFYFLNTTGLHILISSNLLNAMLKYYRESNAAMIVLPHYDEEEKMDPIQMNANYIKYCVVMWLFSLPIHAQEEQLESKNGFDGLLDSIDGKLRELAGHVASVSDLQLEPKHQVFIKDIARRVRSLNQSSNSRRPESSITIVNALRMDPPQFHLLYKYYFSYEQGMIRINMINQLNERLRQAAIKDQSPSKRKFKNRRGKTGTRG